MANKKVTLSQKIFSIIWEWNSIYTPQPQFEMSKLYIIYIGSRPNYNSNRLAASETRIKTIRGQARSCLSHMIYVDLKLLFLIFDMSNDICTCSWDAFATRYKLFFFSYQLFELKLPTFSTELPTSCSVQISTFFSQLPTF